MYINMYIIIRYENQPFCRHAWPLVGLAAWRGCIAALPFLLRRQGSPLHLPPAVPCTCRVQGQRALARLRLYWVARHIRNNTGGLWTI